MWELNKFLVSMSTMYLNFDEGRFVFKVFCTHYYYASPNEVYCLLLYPEHSVMTLDQLSPRLERDRAVRVTTGVSAW